MNKYKKLLSDTALFTISSFASKLLVFIMLPFYTNILTTTEYAIADLISTTISLLLPILTLCISEATLRFSFEKEIKKSSILTIVVIIISLSTGLLVLAEPLIGKFSSTLADYWFYFVIIYVCTALQQCLSCYVRGCNRVRVFALQGIVQTIFLIVFNVLFLPVLGWQLKGYLWATIFSFVVSIFYMVIFGKVIGDFDKFWINKGLAKQMLKYCIPIIPTGIAWYVMQSSDKYMIIWKLGLAASGIYSVSYKIPSILSVIASLFTQAWQISAFSNYGENDNANFVGTVYRYYHFISVISCSGLILIAQILGKILFAKEYFAAWTYVPILLIAYVFSGLSGFLAANFTASKKTNVLFLSTCVGAAINIGLNFILIDKMGVMGATYTTLLGFFVTWLIRFEMSKKIIEIKVPLGKHLIIYVLLLMEAICIYQEIHFSYLIGIGVFILILILSKSELLGLLRKIKITNANQK